MAFKNLASLVAKLEVQSAQWHAELDKANRKLDRFSRDAKRSLGGLDALTAKLATAMRGLAGVMASAFGAAAIGRGITSAAKFGDEIQKAAGRAGIAASEMSKFAAVGQKLDIGLDTLSKSFREMQVSLSRAATGSESESRLFSALGLEVQKLKALKPEQQLMAVIDQLRKFKDPADAARAGTELFGKSWAEITPLIAEGSDGIRKLISEQERMGNVFNDDQLRRMADVDDAIKRLDSSWTRFWRTLTTKVSPALSTILDLLSGAGKGQQWALLQASAKLAADIKYAASYGDKVRVDKLTAERNEIERSLLAFSKGPSSRRGSAANVTTGAPPGFAPVGSSADRGEISEVMTTAVRLFDRSTAVLGTKASALDAETLENTRFDQFGDQLNEVLERTTHDFHELNEASRQASDAMQVYADESMRGIQRSLSEFFLDPAREGIKGLGRSIVDVFRETFANILAAKVASGLFGSVDAKGSLSGGLLSGAINALFGGGKASGGPVDVGRSYLVGERGPELFTPGRNGFITPNGAGGGAVTIYQNVDARGATVDAIKLLPSAMKAASDDAVARIHQQRKSGRI